VYDRNTGRQMYGLVDGEWSGMH